MPQCTRYIPQIDGEEVTLSHGVEKAVMADGLA